MGEATPIFWVAAAGLLADLVGFGFKSFVDLSSFLSVFEAAVPNKKEKLKTRQAVNTYSFG